MAKMTVLEITQDILSDMDSDDVNSIFDTVESLQVANIVRTTYFNIVNGKHYPHQKTLVNLTGLSDTDTPTHMKLPENLIALDSVRYNKKGLTDTKDKYSKVTYKDPDEFLNLVDARDSSQSNIESVFDISGTSLYILNDRAPSYYTSFDDEYIVFDSYDNEVDNTLTESKTQCYGLVLPDFELANDFIPDLPIQLFSYLLNEAKSTCFLTLKQLANQKAEQNSISQRRRMSQEAWRIKRGIQRPNYGRQSKKG